MVQGEMVLMRGFQCGTLYNLLGRIVIDGCNIYDCSREKNEERKVPDVSRGNIMLWHQIFNHYKVIVWLKLCLIVIHI